ncbi:MAG: XdhC family protein [Cyclobacteriaceae bacterium]|nr:XdhC family protein [Cyclobacteriaceae bacterium]
MTHELRNIFENFTLAKKQGIKTVLATVVDLDGSSYRKPGVRMLIWENGYMLGAVSGGCVEKEILKQSSSVFTTGTAKVMTYDGRYRLGCEGVIYILIESFNPTIEAIESFEQILTERTPFEVASSYNKEPGDSIGFGSVIKHINGDLIPFSGDLIQELEPLNSFVQEMYPCNRLLIIGAEHDAVELCKIAQFAGWEVSIICSISNPKTTKDFPGSKEVLALQPELLANLEMDNQTAVVLMSHNYATDLKNLLAIKEKQPIYIGILGAKTRKEKLLDEFLTFHPEVEGFFLSIIHGPAGINIGAITPQEIAISIMAEIMIVVRRKEHVVGTRIIETLMP